MIITPEKLIALNRFSQFLQPQLFFLVIASMMMSKDTQSSPIQGGSKRSLTTYLFKKFAES